MSTRDPGLFRTQFAIQQQDLAATFNAAMSKTRIAPGDYAPELTAPEGQSTGGGAQALQRVRLVPRAPGLPTLVVGSANQRDGTAELRTFEHVDVIHRERFKRPVALDRAQYDAWLAMAQNFFNVMRLRVAIAGPPPPGARSTGDDAPAGGGRGSAALYFVLGGVFVLVALGVAAAAYWWFKMRGAG